MIGSDCPRALALTTGSMLDAPMSALPDTTAWTAFSPEPKFCSSTRCPAA